MTSLLCIIGGRERTLDTSYDAFSPQNSVSDHVPILQLDIIDSNSANGVYGGQEIVVFDNANNPTINMLLNPLLYAPLGSTTLTQPPPNTQNPTMSWTTYVPTNTALSYGTNPYGSTLIFSANGLIGPTITQYTQKRLIADNMQYCLSVHLDTANMQSGYAFITMNYYASTAPTQAGSGGSGSSALLGSTYQQYAQSSSGEQRVSIIGTAPVGTKYIGVSLGIIASNQAISCTFRAVQLEPLWFPDLQPYPTADCNQYSANCYMMPNNLAIRQNRLFAGIIVDTDIVSYDGTSRILKVGCKGPSYLLQTQYANGTFQQQYDKTIIQQIINTSTLPGRLTTYGVQQGAFIDERVYDDVTLEEVLNDFVNTSNFTYFVTWYYDLVYIPLGTLNASARLSDVDSEIDYNTVYPYSGWTCTRDITQLANVVNVHGAPFKRSLQDSFTADGTLKSFPLTESKPIDVTSVKVNGVEQGKGVFGNAQHTFALYQVLVDFPNHRINFQNNPANGTGIIVQYDAESQIKVQVRDVYSIDLYGFEAFAKINDTNLTTTAAAMQRGLQELAQRAYELVTPKFHTLLALQAGQTAIITNSTELNADHTPLFKSAYQVNKSTPHLLGGGVIEYEIECGSDIPDYTRVNKRLHHTTARSKRLAGAALTGIDIVLRDSLTIGQDTLTVVVTGSVARPG